MITFYTRTFVLFAVIFFINQTTAQNDLIVYAEPEFAVNHKVSDTYKINFAATNRNYIYRDDSFEFSVRHLQFSHFSTYNFNADHSVSAGIMYRFLENFEDRSNELRLTQQYNFANRPNVIRFGHRFRSEQRLTDNAPVYRFRYRFAIDFPLQGERLDTGEAYFVADTEALLSVASTDVPEVDQRFTSQIGWQWTPNLKFQIGWQFRFENYNNDTEHVLFLLTSVILKI